VTDVRAGLQPGPNALSDDAARALHADAVRLTRSDLISAVVWWVAAAGVTAFSAVSFRPFLTISVLAMGATSVRLIAMAKAWTRLHRIDSQQFAQLEAETNERLRAERTAHQLRIATATPVATRTLTIVVGVMTAVQFVALGRTSPDAAMLIKSAVRQGEYWRLFSAAFLHNDFLHVAGNLVALGFLGRLVEIYHRPLLVPLIFLVAALLGNIASMMFSSANSLGASGGVMGLAGYLLVLSLRPSAGAPEFLKEVVMSVIACIALIGVANWKFIDNAGHGGGALAGVLLGLALVPRRGSVLTPGRSKWIDAAGWVSAAILAGAVVLTAEKLILARLHR